MNAPVVVCHGRAVDDHGRPYGTRCRNRLRPPKKIYGPRLVAGPAAPTHRAPEPDEVAEIARAKGWAITPWRECGCADHEPGDLHGTCPSCRRPTREALALAKEVASRGA